jgi:hypothetical protein
MHAKGWLRVIPHPNPLRGLSVGTGQGTAWLRQRHGQLDAALLCCGDNPVARNDEGRRLVHLVLHEVPM